VKIIWHPPTFTPPKRKKWRRSRSPLPRQLYVRKKLQPLKPLNKPRTENSQGRKICESKKIKDAPFSTAPIKNCEVIDLAVHRQRLTPVEPLQGPSATTELPVAQCFVHRPDLWHKEIFRFVRVPSVGEKVILEDHYDRYYIVKSVEHLACRRGSNCPPFLTVYLGPPKKARSPSGAKK
jgi:hypothetical protein